MKDTTLPSADQIVFHGLQISADMKPNPLHLTQAAWALLQL